MRRLGFRNALAVLSLAVCGCAHTPASTAASKVILVPQWHLAPGTNTNPVSGTLPQTENQLAVFKRLEAAIDSGEVATVVVEGCEAREIDDGFPKKFNGWTMKDLEEKLRRHETIDDVMTHVGLKIKAKYGSKARVVCGDDDSLVERHQLILSDLRGLTGFRTRLEQFKNEPSKREDYLKIVREILKLKASANYAEVRSGLDSEMLAKIAEFRRILSARDASFVKAAKASPQPAAIVVGAVHVADLQKRFSDAQVPVAIETLPGLPPGDGDLIDRLEGLLRNR